jgi:hypothetical protein
MKLSNQRLLRDLLAILGGILLGGSSAIFIHSRTFGKTPAGSPPQGAVQSEAGDHPLPSHPLGERNPDSPPLAQTSLLDQATEIERFKTAYQKNPRQLRQLVRTLGVPEPLKSKIIEDCVKQAAKTNPQDTLAGIEELVMRRTKDRLVTQAAAEWGKSDPESAFQWVGSRGYLDALTPIAPSLWQKDPSKTWALMKAMAPERQIKFLTGLAYSDLALPPQARKDLHALTVSLAGKGDPTASAIEGALLKKMVQTDMDYVDQYLRSQSSERLTNSILPDLALAKSQGDWRSAYEWLNNYYDDGALNAATVDFWTKWAASGEPSLIKHLDENINSDRTKDMVRYLRNLSKTSEVDPDLTTWLNQHPDG